MQKMDPEDLVPGTVVQLNPQTVGNAAFAGCFMIVTEPKSFGAQGYVQDLGTREAPGGAAYYRAGWEEMEIVGMAIWVSQPFEAEV